MLNKKVLEKVEERGGGLVEPQLSAPVTVKFPLRLSGGDGEKKKAKRGDEEGRGRRRLKEKMLE